MSEFPMPHGESVRLADAHFDMTPKGRESSMSGSENDGKRGRGRKALLAVIVTAFMVATSFAVVGQVLQKQTRAEMLSEVPMQWQKYVNGAIERGEIPNDASPQMVKDWLGAKMPYLSEKVKNSWVNPEAAKDVAEREAAGSAGEEIQPVTGTGKILVLLVEFAGSDTYKGVTYTGPMHNQIPAPTPDNNVDYWTADFGTQHYQDMLFGSRGVSLANYLKAQSHGLYTVDGYVTAWVQIKDHSEWWYGADSRTGGEGSDDLNGPTWRVAIDAAKAAYDTYGTSIPWADFDANGDGWIDSLMVIRAGMDQSGSGAAWTVWAHSWFVDYPNGYEVAPGLPKVGSYTTEPENEGLGVYAHEYGHQLGLPDEYDVTYYGESPVGFLGLMASGSWGPGPTDNGRMALGVLPCDMIVWDKYVLGWENGATAYVNYDGQNAVSSTVNLAQVEGSKGIRALKVELPKQAVTLPLPSPKTGTLQWYSGYKPDISDVLAGSDSSSYILTSAAPVAVPAGGATLSFYEWYNIETYYDWAFVEVSADGGASWNSLAGRYTTTANPYGGNAGNGLTGSARHYVQETMDLSAYAGQSIQLRFRLTQDGAAYGLGWTIDDITVTAADGTIILQDLVTPDSVSKWVVSSTDELGPGWTLSTANAGGSFRHYYIMEWRNFVGYDATLSMSYQFVGLYVQFWSHTPGLMIWYRNFAIGDNSVGLHPGSVAIGVVDAHPEPLMMANGHYVRERVQLMDAAFGLRQTIGNTITFVGVPTTYGPLPAATTFDDSKPYFYYQVKQGALEYAGLMLPHLGLTTTVLSEKADLTGATISVLGTPL